MFQSKLSIHALSAIILVTIFTFAPLAGAEEVKKSKDGKAALVNGRIISTDDFNREYNLYNQYYRARSPQLPPDFMQKLRTQVVQEMINQELLFQASQKQKVTVDKADIDKEIAAFQKQFPSADQYQNWLTNMKFTEEGFKAQISKRMVVRALVEKEVVSKIVIKDEEAKAYFEQNPNKFQVKESVRARHILIKPDPPADGKAKAKARQELTDIKKKIIAGDDFAELAKTHSQGPSGARGGDLGYFEKGKMVKPFDEVAFKLAVNEVSDIVETQFGYHLIKVLDHKVAENPKFDEAKAKAIKIIRDERIKKQVTEYIGKLREGATIETFVN